MLGEKVFLKGISDEGNDACPHVTPCFPKYGVRVRDSGQQILTKSEISSMSTLGY